MVGCDGAGKTALLERFKISKFTNRRFAPSTVAASCRSGHHSRRAKNCATVDAQNDFKDDINVSKYEAIKKRYPQHELRMDKIRPTVGQNIAKNINFFGSNAFFWDLGGQKQMRPLWHSYFSACDAVIFVVDGTIFYSRRINPQVEDDEISRNGNSNSRLEETKEELTKLIQAEVLSSVPLLIWVNKLDEVMEQHLKHSNYTPYMDSVDLDNLDEYWQNELYECVMQLMGLASPASLPLVEPIISAPELADISSLYPPGKPGRLGRMKVFVGSAKTGQGVRPAMEWLSQASALYSR